MTSRSDANAMETTAGLARMFGLGRPFINLPLGCCLVGGTTVTGMIQHTLTVDEYLELSKVTGLEHMSDVQLAANHQVIERKRQLCVARKYASAVIQCGATLSAIEKTQKYRRIQREGFLIDCGESAADFIRLPMEARKHALLIGGEDDDNADGATG